MKSLTVGISRTDAPVVVCGNFSSPPEHQEQRFQHHTLMIPPIVLPFVAPPDRKQDCTNLSLATDKQTRIRTLPAIPSCASARVTEYNYILLNMALFLVTPVTFVIWIFGFYAQRTSTLIPPPHPYLPRRRLNYSCL